MPDWWVLLPLIALPAVAAAYFTVWRRTQPRRGSDLDASILQALKRSGVDLTKPAYLSFLLYFDTEERARAAATQFATPWRSEVSPPPKGTLWLCTVSRTAVPALDAIREWVSHCEAVAATTDGQYDGWTIGGLRE